MPWPWQNWMEGRIQDKEIRKFLDLALDNLTFAGYGGMATNSNPAYSLGGTWQKFTDFDVFTVPNPRNATPDLTNNTLEFNVPGVWIVLLSFTFDHNESNQGRTTNLRLFNETTGAPSVENPIGIGRNQPVTNFGVSILVDIPEAAVGNEYSVELGNGDSVTGNFSAFRWSVVHVGEFSEGGAAAQPGFQAQAVVEPAYGGMAYIGDPTSDTAGLIMEKIEVFDQPLPPEGVPVNVRFDPANSEVVCEQSGVYVVSAAVNFTASEERTYTIELYVNGNPTGKKTLETVAEIEDEPHFVEIPLSDFVVIPPDSRISLWVGADRSADFGIRDASLFVARVSPRLS